MAGCNEFAVMNVVFMMLLCTRYRGEVRKNMWHGKGTCQVLVFPCTDESSGKLLHSNGDVYEGEFVHDAKNGKGVIVEANGGGCNNFHKLVPGLRGVTWWYRSKVQGRMERQRAVWQRSIYLYAILKYSPVAPSPTFPFDPLPFPTDMKRR
eukprot:755107-Hanusia_phi.AAC.2